MLTTRQNLGSNVFWVWGGTCTLCFVYAYFLVWETKGLTLEQVDQMMMELHSPRHSSGWKPTQTFVQQMGFDTKVGDETREDAITGKIAQEIA